MRREADIFRVTGVMSGTSMDGLDLAYCQFIHKNGQWTYELKNAETINYDDVWNRKLRSAENADALELAALDADYGKFIGKAAREFMDRFGLQADLVASHGHTIFHQPQHGFTLQIGHGAAIASHCGLPVANDFRSLDVALGGQGAPLVPVGDKMLFPEYSYCLNLGGFANISYDNEQEKRVAFDICPVNIALNELAAIKGKKYDDKGELARSGKLDQSLLEQLNGLDHYRLPPPKSLGREWLTGNFLPVLERHQSPAEDKLRTVTEHIAGQVGHIINSNNQAGRSRILITGGGAYNEFLMSRIRELVKGEITLPADTLINFKEALIFAFLGVLRLRNEVNCLSSVTGAQNDSCSGVIHNPVINTNP